MRSWNVMNMIYIYKNCVKVVQNVVEKIAAWNFLPGIFCTLLVLCSGVSHALALEPIYREISGADKSPIILRYFKSSDDPVVLRVQNKKFVGAKDQETNLLANYYQLMKSGEFEKVADLFYENDGSRDRYLNDLRENPTRNTGYAKLTKVEISDRFGWGPFQVIRVNLLGKGGLQLKWREAVICSADICYLSNSINKQNKQFDMFGHYTRLAASSISQSELEKRFNSGKAEYWLPDNAASYSGFNQYPVAVSVSLTKVVSKNIDLNAKNITTKVGTVDLKELVEFIKELQIIGKSFENLEKDEIDANKIATELSKVIERRIFSKNKNYEFNLVSKYANEKSIFSEWYHPIAAIQRITKWSAINVIGFAEVDDRLAVYFQPELISVAPKSKPLIEPVQLFILGKTKAGQWKVTLEAGKSKYAYLFDNQIINSIQQQHGQAISFVYSK